MKLPNHNRRFLLFLVMLSATTFGMAQTSFDPKEGCLNVIDVTLAQGIGEYGDKCISANYLHDCYPAQFINDERTQANIKKNVGQWELFVYYLESKGKLKK